MRKITILIALFIGVMFGCQNSDLELVPTENLQTNDPFIPLRETFDFTYNGKTYSSPFYMENDTLMILEDEEVAAVYDRVQDLPELATYITPLGEIEYYNTYEELEKNKRTNKFNTNSSMTGVSYTIMIFEHADFNAYRHGRKESFFAPIEIPDLGSFYGMDEMISSFTAGNFGQPSLPKTCAITFFRNTNYEAQSITFTYKEGTRDVLGYYYYCKVENFHNYKVKKGINWNDRISSLKTFE